MESAIRERIEKIEDGIAPDGYKDTKIGIIPEDWEVKKLGKVGKFFRGKGIPKSEIEENGIDCIIYGQIYTIYNYFTKELYGKVNYEVANKSIDIKYGDLLFASSGETSLEIGKCIMYLGDKRAVAGGDIVIMRPKDIIKNKTYSYLLNSEIINKQKYELAQGHSVVHIYSDHLKHIKIPIIPLQEQEKIADILSTWDKAIEKIEKLIKEKEEQKKGLMQKLLTGEKRLPGFSGEWKEVKLGKISNVQTGKLDANAMVENGEYEFFTCAKETYKIDKYAYNSEVLLVSGNGANVGYIHYYKGKFNAYQRTYILDEFKTDIIFTKFLLDLSLKKRIFREKRAGNTPYITMSTLTDMVLCYPPLAEQKAIAEILSTADEEIELLNRLLENKKEEKKGLMQLLLTGIIRV